MLVTDQCQILKIVLGPQKMIFPGGISRQHWNIQIFQPVSILKNQLIGTLIRIHEMQTFLLLKLFNIFYTIKCHFLGIIYSNIAEKVTFALVKIKKCIFTIFLWLKYVNWLFEEAVCTHNWTCVTPHLFLHIFLCNKFIKYNLHQMLCTVNKKYHFGTSSGNF